MLQRSTSHVMYLGNHHCWFVIAISPVMCADAGIARRAWGAGQLDSAGGRQQRHQPCAAGAAQKLFPAQHAHASPESNLLCGKHACILCPVVELLYLRHQHARRCTSCW